MPDDGFGSSLWRNIQAIKIGKDGGIEAPVRANSRQGIVVGLDAIAKSDAADAADAATSSTPGAIRRLWNRLLRH